MQGAGFTISSLGGIGGTQFTPIVNAPEVAILGVSRSVNKPVWNGEAFIPKPCTLHIFRAESPITRFGRSLCQFCGKFYQGLGVSRSVNKPVWNGEAFIPELTLPLALSYDHRVIDGAQGGRFMAELNHILNEANYD
jgi:pyruvate dehydrogenase E2 component (dihydrolipoamide acetyltransferase)